MSLHPQSVPEVAAETARVARAVFPQGNIYMQLRDELGSIYEDALFAGLFPKRGQPAESPWRLALITVMQYVEGLSDRQAADAVRSRIDWKYVLSLELTDAGFDSSVLSEFRSRLVKGGAEEMLLNILLEKCRQRKWVKANGRQRTDSTYVLGWIRAVNRLVCVAETLRAALNSLAITAPDWLQKNSQPEWPSPRWLERYGRRIEDSRLPAGREKRDTYALQVGIDGYQLLAALYEGDASDWLVRIPAVDTLRQVWLQQFYIQEGKIYWRGEKEGIPAAAQFISSPYDPEAHYARKYTTSWVGYKVHLTETCEEDQPHLITHVTTSAGPIADGAATDQIHESLQKKDLLPATHIVDTGYLDAKLLLTSRQDYNVDLLGPTRPDYRWQARAKEGFAAADFQIDWQQQQATCPEGKFSSSWSEVIDIHGQQMVKIKFAQKDCIACSSWSKCTRCGAPQQQGERLLSERLPSIRHYWRQGKEKKQKNTKQSMPKELALKEPYPKECGPMVYDELNI